MSDCPSEIHKTPVAGTVPGTFRNWHNPANNGPVTYCEKCALWSEAFGFFTPSAEVDTKAKEPATWPSTNTAVTTPT